MGIEKINRALSVGGVRLPTESKTSTGAGGTLDADGASFIVSASTVGSNIFHLPSPRKAGDLKVLHVAVGTTDAVDVLNSATTSRTFKGTTANALRFSTAAPKAGGALLLAASTTQWAVVAMPANASLVGSTGV